MSRGTPGELVRVTGIAGTLRIVRSYEPEYLKGIWYEVSQESGRKHGSVYRVPKRRINKKGLTRTRNPRS